MPRPINRLARAGLLAACAVGVLTGCSEEEPGTSGGQQGTAPAERKPDQVYTVRGEVRQLPDGENPALGLQIRHEHIPDFVNREGEVVGMRPMIMQFTPGPAVDLSGLTVGDKIRFTFDVDWDGSPLFMVTGIERLAPETELDFALPAPGGG